VAKYRVTLGIKVITKPIVIEAENNSELMKQVESIDLSRVLRDYGDGLEVNLMNGPVRVYDTVQADFKKEGDNLKQLEGRDERKV